MSKGKKLSPKQKKIAAMAGDPNKIEGEDFQKLKTMKAKDGVSVDFPMDHPDTEAQYEFVKKRRDRIRKDFPTLSSIADDEDVSKERSAKFLGRMAQRRAERLTATEGSFNKGGSVMARGCKMGRNKKTKIY